MSIDSHKKYLLSITTLLTFALAALLAGCAGTKIERNSLPGLDINGKKLWVLVDDQKAYTGYTTKLDSLWKTYGEKNHLEIEENSELDLLEAFQKHANDPRIDDVVKDMVKELGGGNKIPQVLPKLAQYELTLTDWIEGHKGSRQFVTVAAKCWPAFQTMFGFVPCYVNSRLASRGIPVACEVDIYGALSEFIGTCITQDAVTLLDINNSVPKDMYEESIKGKKFLCDEYTDKEIFMGFHCGNTASSKVCNCQMCFQRIMARALPIEVTNGTLEGDLKPGKATVYRLQSTADTKLRAYMAQGEILPVATRSFGSIGTFGIKNMSRFYRHVLIEKHYPHHAAVMFDHAAKYLWEVLKYMGIPVEEIDYNFPKGNYYPTENPFA